MKMSKGDQLWNFLYTLAQIKEVRVSKSSCFTREKVEELRLNLQIQANKNFLKFFVAKTKVITADKKKISIRQLGLFENYKENRI